VVVPADRVGDAEYPGLGAVGGCPRDEPTAKPMNNTAVKSRVLIAVGGAQKKYRVLPWYSDLRGSISRGHVGMKKSIRDSRLFATPGDFLFGLTVWRLFTCDRT
jgi:hypothetical protein